MSIIAWNKETDIAISPERLPVNGEWACFTNDQKITKKQYNEPILADSNSIERSWRDSELVRTDALIILPDYPLDLTAYRAALRAYPEQVDFPNGARPTE